MSATKTPRQKAIDEYISKQRRYGDEAYQTRDIDWSDLQEQLIEMSNKAKMWRDRFRQAEQNFNERFNRSFETGVSVFGLKCKICKMWKFCDIDYVDEFRIENYDRIPICFECAEKCEVNMWEESESEEESEEESESEKESEED